MSWNQTEIIANEEEGSPHQEQSVEDPRLDTITEDRIEDRGEEGAASP